MPDRSPGATSVRASLPNPDDCRGAADVGKLHHDQERDIWYECVFDQRKNVYTWAILPPEMTAPRATDCSCRFPERSAPRNRRRGPDRSPSAAFGCRTRVQVSVVEPPAVPVGPI